MSDIDAQVAALENNLEPFIRQRFAHSPSNWPVRDALRDLRTALSMKGHVRGPTTGWRPSAALRRRLTADPNRRALRGRFSDATAPNTREPKGTRP